MAGMRVGRGRGGTSAGTEQACGHGASRCRSGVLAGNGGVDRDAGAGVRARSRARADADTQQVRVRRWSGAVAGCVSGPERRCGRVQRPTRFDAARLGQDQGVGTVRAQVWNRGAGLEPGTRVGPKRTKCELGLRALSSGVGRYGGMRVQCAVGRAPGRRRGAGSARGSWRRRECRRAGPEADQAQCGGWTRTGVLVAIWARMWNLGTGTEPGCVGSRAECELGDASTRRMRRG
jgi:hypothetical protein